MSKCSGKNSGFSLAEVVASLTIGSMILVAGISLYQRVGKSVSAVTYQLEKSRLGSEVLQRIAEDLDRIIAIGSDVKITIESKTEQHGYSTGKLVISKSYFNEKNKRQNFEEIVWVGSYDFDSAKEGLILYRGHSGLAFEDKLLDKTKEDWQRELYVPICNGVTYFRIQVPGGEEEEVVDKWAGNKLPRAVIVTISFAEPVKSVSGDWEVAEEDKMVRTIAIDRTRKIKFILPTMKDKLGR
ncbi:MAG: hypothetical protein FVQ80_03510 [Planctomycetes bacterium]|nr:hypothetical protein [Planctomycetota bacterium]